MKWFEAAFTSGEGADQTLSTDSAIRHVSDTAFWVSSLRGQEGLRHDAAFYEPLASLLGGPRGRAIARAMPRAAMVAWTYRMHLPASLRWIEVDFPQIVEFKNSKLANQTPVCQLERVELDLLNRHSRHDFLARYAADSANTLVITEGVLPYFSIHGAADLASALRATSPIRVWIQDFDAAGNRKLPTGWAEKLKAAPPLFDAKDWFAFFETYGWRPTNVITSFRESQRLQQHYPIDFPFGLAWRKP